jgi:hypothetical protein
MLKKDGQYQLGRVSFFIAFITVTIRLVGWGYDIPDGFLYLMLTLLGYNYLGKAPKLIESINVFKERKNGGENGNK